MEPKGTLVVDEQILPIVDIYLDGGDFCVVAEIHGPARAVEACGYVVCDRSGGVVYRSDGPTGRLRWAEVEPGDTIRITAGIGIPGRRSNPLGPAMYREDDRRMP